MNTLIDSKLGQSGASISIIVEKDSVYARKSATGITDSSKLFLQFEKHKDFERDNTFFRLPKILSEWTGNSYDMEYISGVTLGTFFQQGNLIESIRINQKIVEIYDSILKMDDDTVFSNIKIDGHRIYIN